jgi:hypothetical protein
MFEFDWLEVDIFWTATAPPLVDGKSQVSSLGRSSYELMITETSYSQKTCKHLVCVKLVIGFRNY